MAATIRAAAELAVVAETTSHRTAFWQAILAGEFSAGKLAGFLSQLDPDDATSVETLLRNPKLTDRERSQIRQSQTASTEGVTWLEEANFPEPLLGVSGLPPALTFRGDRAALNLPAIAIVGTRSAGTYGKACAQKFAEAFARAGVTVVSGGALGIDAAAHRGALNVAGRSIAVLATGVDGVYPPLNAGLFKELLPSGGLLSQYAVGSTPDSYKFLQRNYLIAALSLAVLVVEAPAKSGALRTAQHAAELGREVFVVPANLDNRNFYGSFQLIRDGATLVTHPEQILESLGIGGLFTPANEPTSDSNSLADKILRVLSVDAVAPEILVAQVDADPSDVLAELTVLEIDGLILRDGGKYAKKP